MFDEPQDQCGRITVTEEDGRRDAKEQLIRLCGPW